MNKKFVYEFTKMEVAAALWNQYATNVSDHEFDGELLIGDDTVSLIFTSETSLSPVIHQGVK